MDERPRAIPFLAVLLPIILACTLSACSSNGKARQAGRPPAPVAVGTVAVRDVPLKLEAIGAVEAYNTVSIKSLIGGEVTAVHFQEGQEVKKGDLLFTIDRRPYAAALQQAQAQLARDEAQAKNAEQQADRYQVLVKKNYVSQDQYDQLRASADALVAAVQADKAAVENARLQLAYCSIRSPINGRAGSILINQGNVVKANDLPLVTLTEVTPIYVSFSVPEQRLPEVKRYAAAGPLSVEARIPGDEEHPAYGTLTFIDNAVDPTTGTIRLKGTFPNKDRMLWPGQFVTVSLTLTVQKDAVVMPAAALQNGQQGQYAFVVKPDDTVESQPVTVARVERDLAVVLSGVTAGERVVTDGQLGLVPGARVEVKGEQQKSQGEVPKTVSPKVPQNIIQNVQKEAPKTVSPKVPQNIIQNVQKEAPKAVSPKVPQNIPQNVQKESSKAPAAPPHSKKAVRKKAGRTGPETKNR